MGRVFCTRQVPSLDGKKMLLVQPLDWETGEPSGEILAAVDAVGAGAGEKVYWVAAREAAVAFTDVPPIDAAVVGIIDGSQIRDFRK